MSEPSPAPVVELIEAFRRSKTMFAGVSLGVFDRLERGEADAATLARDLGADGDALERLLDALVALGLLERREGAYRLNDVSAAYLRRSSPGSLVGYIAYSNDLLWSMWGRLEDAVREGTHRWNQTYGLDGPIFSHFYRTEEAMREFIAGMHGFGVLSSPRVVAAFDLGAFRRLVDLGGATGHLALAACERYPALRAAVFDLPAVIRVAVGYIERSPHGKRIDLIAGDFFNDPLPQADLYSVGRILHDWSEDKIRKLVGRISAALPRGGGLLIAEKLLDDDKTGPVSAHMQSLNMLVCTEGKERTAAEYAALLRESGFAEVRSARTGAPLDAILALKA